MTQTEMNMDILYDRLSSLGFPKDFVRSYALPDWWDEEVESSTGAEIEAAAYICRHLNLDLLSLLRPERTPTFKRSCQAKFKIKHGTEKEQLFVAQAMAARIAEMIAYACTPACKPLPKSAKEIRDIILESRELVNLEGLLEFCWNYGIPVVHFAEFPKAKGVRKFDGMVAYFYLRPVIVISLKHKSPARLLFILAHELGHIVKGHLHGDAIVDENIELEIEDEEEVEANEFALELLLGKPDMRYDTPRNLTGEQLAAYAKQISSRDGVDTGTVALNYAYNKAKMAATQEKEKKAWGTASKALKLLEGDVNAPTEINRYALKDLNLERLDIDSQDYLELVAFEV
ncbi:MAG: ImmA/IrrE family metallo-endopeptidase [Hormoscilla sp. SP5CHS1]|nr:ImmA/IrrE family metallo-endopeptidase [Hormoscilla sp. SP12CHS1]MBC6452747.1 ImmA/IrrE family metallo-endopeptidase [Hormoscilla sp. SP5CHS1]